MAKKLTKRVALCLSVLCVLAVGLFAVQCLRTSGTPLNVTTTSPIEQDGLTYLGVYRGLPKGLGKIAFSRESPEDRNKLWAYFRRDPLRMVGYDCRLVASDSAWLRPYSQLSDPLATKPDTLWTKLVNFFWRPRKRFVEPQIFRVELPSQHSPNFSYLTVDFYPDKGAKRSWKLAGLPESSKVIKDNEPSVWEGTALGVKFRLPEPIRSSFDVGYRGLPGSAYIHYATLKMQNIPESGVDNYEIEMQRERQTWNKPVPAKHTVPLGNYVELPVEFGVGEPMQTRRLEFSITLRRFRYYDEDVVLRDLRIVKGRQESWAVVGCSNRRNVTKSGVAFTMVPSERNVYFFDGHFVLKLLFDQPMEDIKAPRSPYAELSIKPIQVVDIRDNSLEKGRSAHWYYPVEFDATKKSADLPELIVTIRQKVILAEEKVHFLAPVKPVRDD